MRSFGPLPVLLGLVLLNAVGWYGPLAASDVSSAQRAAAEKTLRALDLELLGEIWITQRERRLRAHLSRVEKSHRRYRKVEQRLDELLKANETNGAKLLIGKQQLAQLKKAKPKGNATQLQQHKARVQQVEKIVAVLRRRYVPSQRLAEAAPARHRAGELAEARTALMLLLATIRDHVGRLEDDYRPLRKDAAVRSALQTLGAERLGSMRDFDRELRRVAELEGLLNKAPLPFYRQSGRLRIGVLVNHRTPATFTLLESGGETLIPSSLVQAAAIDIPDDAPRVIYRTKRRKLETRRVTIAYLRIGSAELREVTALALPPEGEDLGAQLAPSALSGYRMKLDSRRLRLHLEPIDEER